ncbi:MAG TPA: heme o synthase [Candidatus Saccharimonadales bacterium]|nr:heme o synthase [Candidatus Saccharimonadales bacterium]
MAGYKTVELLKAYAALTKPRVMMANALTSAAGYLLASGNAGRFYGWRFLALFAGSSLVIASACAINNYLDRDIDSIMERTRKRPTATGQIGRTGAVTYSILLLAAGLAVLSLWTNRLVVLIGIAGFIDYVWLYGALSKRRSVHGTLVGSISGAVPVLAGYVAVSDRIDAGAALAFASLFFWQMPEFYSIAIYRRKEYAAAGVPIISVVKGVKRTAAEIFFYMVLFVASALLLTVFGYTGWIYFGVMAVLGIYWLSIAGQGLKGGGSDAWARRVFHFSMIIILVYCVALSAGPLIP